MFLSGTIRNVFAVFALLLALFSFSFATSVPSTAYAANDGTAQADGSNPNSNPSVTSDSPDTGGFLSGVGNIIPHIFSWVGIITLQFSLFILAIVGTLLDLSLLLTFNMGAIINQGTTLGHVVAQSWSIFRDLANLLFIAGFVWVSIAMILQISVPGGNNGKFIANIIIAALLVNFSYFFAGAIIDASNTVSRLIYEEGVLNGQHITVGAQVTSITDMIRQVTSGDVSGGNAAAANAANTDVKTGLKAYASFIGGQFMYQTKLVTIFDPESLKVILEDKTGTTGVALTTLIYMGVALIGATIELFTAMLFAILGRFLILLVLLVLSPLIVFRIMGIQPFAAWGDAWWKALMSQVIFLPVFLFLVAISFRITNGFAATFQSAGIGFNQIFGSPSGPEFETALALILLFVMSWGLLKQSKTIAQNLAAGKQVPLPSVEGIQNFAAGWGNKAGSVARQLGQLPRAGFYGVLGGTGNRVGQFLGVQEGVEGLDKSWRSRPGFLGGNRFEVEREENAKKNAEKRAREAHTEIAYWESVRDTARNSGDRAKEFDANDKLNKANDRRDAAYGHMFDTLGAKKMARYLADHPEQRDGALDSLDDAKAREVTDALAKIGVKVGKKSNEVSAGNTNSTPEKRTEEKVLEELRGLRADEHKTYFKEHATELRDMTAEAKTAREIIAAIRESGGAPGELSADVIINNENVIRQLDDNDMAVIKGREDISDEDYAAIKKAYGIAKNRGLTPSPSDIARKPEDGE